MKACVDVDLPGQSRHRRVCPLPDWSDAEPAETIAIRIDGVAPMCPRVLQARAACLLAVLARVADPVELVIVDGYVWLADDDHPGLGAHLTRL